MISYAVIIPVYNRPDEGTALFERLHTLRLPDFELLVLAAGSSVSCNSVYD